MSGKSVQQLEEDLVNCFELIQQLSGQLAANQATVEELKTKAGHVKGQAVHSTGFPLRRFNIDITEEEFKSELERFASHLVLQVQDVSWDNRQLSLLLREEENTIDLLMQKFRAVCHASVEHELKLHRYYTDLIQQLQTTHSTTVLHDSTTLSTLLQRLSGLLRAALRSVAGEDAGDVGFDMPQTKDLKKAIQDIGSLSASSGRPPVWLGDQGRGGGYAGNEGRADWAMEREGEIARLEAENQMLRDMLGVASDVDVASIVREAEEKGRREERQRIMELAAKEELLASPRQDVLTRSTSTPTVGTPIRARAGSKLGANSASNSDQSLSTSPGTSKSQSSLAGTSPTSSSSLEKITSPSTPLSSLFLRPGSRTKTEPTTAISLDDGDLSPASPTSSRRSSTSESNGFGALMIGANAQQKRDLSPPVVDDHTQEASGPTDMESNKEAAEEPHPAPPPESTESAESEAVPAPTNSAASDATDASEVSPPEEEKNT